MNMSKIKVYGADSCSDTRRSLQHLNSIGIDYDYINVKEDASASEWVKQQNSGKERIPTIDIDGKILSVPSNSELDAALP
jgi:mycoredoxin